MQLCIITHSVCVSLACGAHYWKPQYIMPFLSPVLVRELELLCNLATMSFSNQISALSLGLHNLCQFFQLCKCCLHSQKHSCCKVLAVKTEKKLINRNLAQGQKFIWQEKLRRDSTGRLRSWQASQHWCLPVPAEP